MTERSEISISTFNKKPCVRKIVRQAGGIVFLLSGAHLKQKKPIYLPALVSFLWRHHTLRPKNMPLSPVWRRGKGDRIGRALNFAPKDKVTGAEGINRCVFLFSVLSYYCTDFQNTSTT